MKHLYIFLVIIKVITFFCFVQSCDKNESSKIIVDKNHETKSLGNPIILLFLFQPSLEENSEITIDFTNNKLIFRNIYEYLEEPPPPPSKNGISKTAVVPTKPLQPFVADLSLNEIENLKKIINALKDEDYKRKEGTYIDGMSCNFMIYDGKNVKNGFIARYKTPHQADLQKSVLNLLLEKNKFQENVKVINYYYNY